jgi:hypothetical protein
MMTNRMRSRPAPAITFLSRFVAGVLLSSVALAGPPYETDDPVPADLGKWEIYAYTAGTGFGKAAEGEAGLDINYGAAKDLQLTAVVPMAYERGEKTHLGDVELEAKYLFLHQKDGTIIPDIAFYPGIILPTSGHRYGSGKVGAGLLAFAQKDLGDWSMFGGGGYSINPGPENKDFWEIGYALTRTINDKLEIGGEIHHQGAEEYDGAPSTSLGLGFEYAIADKWSILGAGGPIIQNHRQNGDFTFYLGIAFAN